MKRHAQGALALARDAVRSLFLLPVLAYQLLISPALPARCKYHPTCSAYAMQAVRELGVVRGTIVAAWRLARCNPWSHGGVDELADRSLFRNHAATPNRSPDARSSL